VLRWDPGAPGTAPVELGRHDGLVNAVAALADGRAVSGSEDGRLLLWDAGRGVHGTGRASAAATTR
jgi:hypothetical protein